jgi:hypothetical protein
MTYDNGTVTDANPGPALYAAMEPTLLAAGFTFVKTVTIGARTHKVLKSDADDNSLGLDWYLDIHYPTTGAGTIFFAPFEFFDTATDLGYRGPFCANSTVIDGTTFSRYGATGHALETNWANSTGHSALDTTITATAFGWHLSATTDRVIFASTAAPAELHYCGFFTPTADHAAHAGADLYPLITCHFLSATTGPVTSATPSVTRMAFTRAPKMSAINWSTSGILDTPYARFTGQVGTGGAAGITGGIDVARKPVTLGYNSLIASSGTSAPASFGLAGYLDDVGNTWTDGTIIRGDTLTDDNADTWVAADDENAVGIWFRAV